MSSANTISVAELKKRITDAGGNLDDFVMKLYREGKKLRVEVKPDELNDMPGSSSILYTRTIIPIYIGKGGTRVRRTQQLGKRRRMRRNRRTVRNTKMKRRSNK